MLRTIIKSFLCPQTRLADLQDGQVLVGTVFRQMLYHGAQIDIGAEYDGYVLCFSGPRLSQATRIPLHSCSSCSPFRLYAHSVYCPCCADRRAFAGWCPSSRSSGRRRCARGCGWTSRSACACIRYSTLTARGDDVVAVL